MPLQHDSWPLSAGEAVPDGSIAGLWSAFGLPAVAVPQQGWGSAEGSVAPCGGSISGMCGFVVIAAALGISQGGERENG